MQNASLLSFYGLPSWRRMATLATIFSLVVALAGCGSGKDSANNDGFLIGVAYPSQNQPRWLFEAKTIEDAAKKNGDSVIVNYADETLATQISQVESMFQRGIDVLVIVPVDPREAGLVTEAKNLGIEVISYDRRIEGVPTDYHIERNNYDAGKIHVDAALMAKPFGKYAVIRGDQSTVAEHELSRAYDELLLTNKDIEVVYDEHTRVWSTELAQKEAEAALSLHPDIDAFVVMWDGGSQGVIQALKGAGKKPGDVYVTGMDAAIPNLAYIAQGWQGQTVWTPVDEMSRDAADIAHAFASGSNVPEPDATVDGVKTDNVALASITKDNLCDFVHSIAPAGWASEQDVFGSATGNCG